MDEQRQDNHLEFKYNSFVPIQDVALKTYRLRWTRETGGERRERERERERVREIRVAARQVDDDTCSKLN